MCIDIPIDLGWSWMDIVLMGYLSKLFVSALTPSPKPLERVISFDPDWFDSWEALSIEQQNNPDTVNVKVSFESALLKELWDSIETHTSIGRVAYDEEQQPINNVGESFRQTEISSFCDGLPGEEMDWLAGFLLPEMANEYDKTAVAVYVLRLSESGIESDTPFRILHGGYMDKESAKKVHKKILNLMGRSVFIPLLIRIQGGTVDKPNYGVYAYAKTKAIQFPWVRAIPDLAKTIG